MARSSKKSGSSLPSPYLKRVWLDKTKIADPAAYPFCIPLFRDEFEIRFEAPITILIGENGVGKSTVIEGIAALAGYDDAGGGKGYMPVDHSGALEASGGRLADVMRAAWLPKITNGWFFKAETFFSVSRYLDAAAKDDPNGGPPPDFLSHSHGEGFLRFFEERCTRQGIYFFDEPESALSPARQIEFLKLLNRMNRSGNTQVIMATHSPLLMACPHASLIALSASGIAPTTLENTEHFRVWREFCANPAQFVDDALAA